MRDFRPIRKIQPSPMFRDRPGTNESYLKAAAADGFTCFLRRKALIQMIGWGRAADDKEIIGHLAGRLCQDIEGQYMLVEGATWNRDARCGRAFVHSDIPAQRADRRRLERRYRALESVGWWHTHPSGLGLFYSQTDRQNQATWQDPTAIGIVLDPSLQDETLKVFRGPNSEELTVLRSHAAATMIQSIRNELESKSRNDSEEPDERGDLPIDDFQPEGFPIERPSEGNGKVGVTAAVCMSACALLFAVLTHVFTWNASIKESNLRQPVLNLQTPSGEVVLSAESIQRGKPSKNRADSSSQTGDLNELDGLPRRHKLGPSTRKPDPAK